MKNIHKLRTGLLVITGMAFAPFGIGAVDAGEKEQRVQGSIAVAKGTSESALASMGNVAVTDALGAATAAVPGRPLKIELDREDGFLVWVVEIVGADQKAHEITVDAGNGQVLKKELDSADHDEDDDNGGDED